MQNVRNKCQFSKQFVSHKLSISECEGLDTEQE
jgi:hypothetical protein